MGGIFWRCEKLYATTQYFRPEYNYCVVYDNLQWRSRSHPHWVIYDNLSWLILNLNLEPASCQARISIDAVRTSPASYNCAIKSRHFYWMLVSEANWLREKMMFTMRFVPHQHPTKALGFRKSVGCRWAKWTASIRPSLAQTNLAYKPCPAHR